MIAPSNSRPLEVKRAVWCLWAAFVLSVVVSIVQFMRAAPHLGGQHPSLLLAGGTLLLVAINAIIIYNIAQGRNWARVIQLAFVLVVLLFYVYMFAHLHTLSMPIHRSPFGYISGIVQFLLQVFALWLVFTTPGKTWFEVSQV